MSKMVEFKPQYHKRNYVWLAITKFLEDGYSAITLGQLEEAINLLIDGIIEEVRHE